MRAKRPAPPPVAVAPSAPTPRAGRAFGQEEAVEFSRPLDAVDGDVFSGQIAGRAWPPYGDCLLQTLGKSQVYHRPALLDHVPTEGAWVSISYSGGVGAVRDIPPIPPREPKPPRIKARPAPPATEGG